MISQCPVTRNGYECSRPVHSGEDHNFPLDAYAEQAEREFAVLTEMVGGWDWLVPDEEEE